MIMGKHQIRLLKFAIQYCKENWSSFGKDRTTVTALRSLADYGFIELNWETRQFRLVQK